jgi:hypothetical protein
MESRIELSRERLQERMRMSIFWLRLKVFGSLLTGTLVDGQMQSRRPRRSYGGTVVTQVLVGWPIPVLWIVQQSATNSTVLAFIPLAQVPLDLAPSSFAGKVNRERWGSLVSPCSSKLVL